MKLAFSDAEALKVGDRPPSTAEEVYPPRRSYTTRPSSQPARARGLAYLTEEPSLPGSSLVDE